MTTQTTNSPDYVAILEAFLASPDFPVAVAQATRVSVGASTGYTLELLPEGNWRVLWDGQIGNLYSSPGIMLRVPGFDDDQYTETEDGLSLEDTAELYASDLGLADEMRDGLLDVLTMREGASS